MSTLIVRRPMDFPNFGASKWGKADHKRPLVIKLTHARASIFLDEDTYTKSGIIVFPSGRLELTYDPAPANLLKGLAAKGAASAEAAKQIYESYVEAFTKFEALLFSAGRVRYLMRMGVESLTSFFVHGSLSEKCVEWSVDGKPYQEFQPKLPKARGRNPLYTSAQLVTPARWQDMQRSADDATFPEGELLELYRIRGKLGWRETRTAAIEASIISESLLRAYGLQALKESGFSNSKIKRLRDELTFNNLLNIVLPLSLTKVELRKMQRPIDAVDRLRGIRNDLVHGNITEKEVERATVDAGIDGAIQLVRFLKAKLS